jgi:aconitate hydratase
VTWSTEQTLELVDAPDLTPMSNGEALAIVCHDLDDVRRLAARAAELTPVVRAVFAPFIPSTLVTIFSAAGIAAFEVDVTAKGFKGQRTVQLPAPAAWGDKRNATLSFGTLKLPVVWSAAPRERAWVTGSASIPYT